jgi:hypothetical protein
MSSKDSEMFRYSYACIVAKLFTLHSQKLGFLVFIKNSPYQKNVLEFNKVHTLHYKQIFLGVAHFSYNNC